MQIFFKFRFKPLLMSMWLVSKVPFSSPLVPNMTGVLIVRLHDLSVPGWGHPVFKVKARERQKKRDRRERETGEREREKKRHTEKWEHSREGSFVEQLQAKYVNFMRLTHLVDKKYSPLNMMDDNHNPFLQKIKSWLIDDVTESFQYIVIALQSFILVFRLWRQKRVSSSSWFVAIKTSLAYVNPIYMYWLVTQLWVHSNECC